MNLISACSKEVTETCPSSYETDSCIAFRMHFQVEDKDLELLWKSCAPSKVSCEGLTPAMQSSLSSEAEKYGLQTKLVKCAYSPTCYQHDLCNGELPMYDSANPMPGRNGVVVALLTGCLIMMKY